MVIEIAKHEAAIEQLADREIPAHAAREISPAVHQNLADKLGLPNGKLYEPKLPVREVGPEALTTALEEPMHVPQLFDGVADLMFAALPR